MTARTSSRPSGVAASATDKERRAVALPTRAHNSGRELHISEGRVAGHHVDKEDGAIIGARDDLLTIGRVEHVRDSCRVRLERRDQLQAVATDLKHAQRAVGEADGEGARVEIDGERRPGQARGTDTEALGDDELTLQVVPHAH
eukprot:scaffold83085_cov24-Tisochrysis_lutea.AAC.4